MKFRNIFLITLIVNILGLVPLFLVLFMSGMRETMVYAQFPGMETNELANEIFNVMMGVFGTLGVAMIVGIFYAMRIKSREGAIAASFILLVWNVGWVAPDWYHLMLGSGGHPPLMVMLLGLVPVVLLSYGLQKGKI